MLLWRISANAWILMICEQLQETASWWTCPRRKLSMKLPAMRQFNLQYLHGDTNDLERTFTILFIKTTYITYFNSFSHLSFGCFSWSPLESYITHFDDYKNMMEWSAFVSTVVSKHIWWEEIPTKKHRMLCLEEMSSSKETIRLAYIRSTKKTISFNVYVIWIYIYT